MGASHDSPALATIPGVMAGTPNNNAAAAYVKFVTGKDAAATWKAASIDAL
jgi:hypothetical protein